MNIAIKGSKNLKNEVIDALISLGGVNRSGFSGEVESSVYYINFDCDNIISTMSESDAKGFFICTIEDFMNSYLFRPGDEAIFQGNVVTIREIVWSKYCNYIYYVSTDGVKMMPEELTPVGGLVKGVDPFQPGFDVYWNERLCCIVSINEEGLGDGDPIYRVSPYDDPLGETYGTFRRNLLPPDLDPECVKLVTCLNDVVGVTTFGSCCGHLESNYFVFFRCSDHEKLARLSRSVNRNYSDGKWLIELTDTDGSPCYNYMLRSKKPFVTLDEMVESVNSLVDNILHWNSSDFDSYFKTNGNCNDPVINLGHYKNPEVELVLGDRDIVERDGKFYAVKRSRIL